MQLFNLPCHYPADVKEGVDFFVGEPNAAFHPLAFQRQWLKHYCNGLLADDLVTAFEAVQKRAAHESASFEELALAALAEAKQAQGDEDSLSEQPVITPPVELWSDAEQKKTVIAALKAGPLSEVDADGEAGLLQGFMLQLSKDGLDLVFSTPEELDHEEVIYYLHICADTEGKRYSETTLQGLKNLFEKPEEELESVLEVVWESLQTWAKTDLDAKDQSKPLHDYFARLWA